MSDNPDPHNVTEKPLRLGLTEAEDAPPDEDTDEIGYEGTR